MSNEPEKKSTQKTAAKKAQEPTEPKKPRKKGKILMAVIILIAAVSVYLFPNWFEKQYKKIWGYYYVYKGDKAYKAAKYQKAVDYYLKGLEYYPEHSKARCNLGHLYVVFENYYAAADAYDEALKYKPDYMSCRMDYGIILSERLADYDKAVQEYGKIVEARPFLLYIPFIYNNLKSVKENRGLAYYNMGVAYRKKSIYMGENTKISLMYLKKAKESYTNAQKMLPDDYDTHYNAAFTNQLLGNKKESGLEYCKAIEIRPYNFEAHYNYALLLRSLKFYKEALSELEKAGMLAELGADQTQKEYIYEVLGEVKQILVNEGEIEFLNNRVEESANDSSELAYRNGKVILKEDADKLLTKKLKKCPKKEYFEEL